MPGAAEDRSRAVAARPVQALSGGGGLVRAPFRYPKLTATLLLWALGLFLAFLARPPAITPEATAAFMSKIKEAEALLPELTKAERQLMIAELEQRQHKVWFWRFKPEARRQVEARQGGVDAAHARVAEVAARKDALLREAKASLGLWSEAGVAEGRELFWESYAAGKLFAQRRTFWDSLWIILGSRERDWLSMLLNLLFQTVMNFITGVTLSLFVFLARLPGMIASYGPTLLSGAAFFALCAVAAASVVASYVGLLVGAGGTAAYASLSLAAAAHQQRLEGGGGRRRIAYQHED